MVMFRLINVIIQKNEKYISRKKIYMDQAKFCEHELFFQNMNFSA